MNLLRHLLKRRLRSLAQVGLSFLGCTWTGPGPHFRIYSPAPDHISLKWVCPHHSAWANSFLFNAFRSRRVKPVSEGPDKSACGWGARGRVAWEIGDIVWVNVSSHWSNEQKVISLAQVPGSSLQTGNESGSDPLESCTRISENGMTDCASNASRSYANVFLTDFIKI